MHSRGAEGRGTRGWWVPCIYGSATGGKWPKDMKEVGGGGRVMLLLRPWKQRGGGVYELERQLH